MFCPNCGKDIGDAKFCPECGAPAAKPAATQPQTQPAPPTQGKLQMNYTPIPQNQTVPTNVKKPVYKKWWFWAIIVVVGLALIGAITPRKNATKPSGNETSSATASTTPTAKADESYAGSTRKIYSTPTPKPTAAQTTAPTTTEQATAEEAERSTAFADGNHEYTWFDITISIPDTWTAIKADEEAQAEAIQGFAVDRNDNNGNPIGLLRLQMEEGGYTNISNGSNTYVNNTLNKLANGKKGDVTVGTVDGHDGFSFTYSYEDDSGNTVQAYQVLFISGDGDIYQVLFIISEGLLDYYADDVIQIVQSIKIDDSNAHIPTTGESNALRQANSYLSFMAFSRDGLIDQLEFEGYTSDEAVYAVDNCGANWNEQAVKKAKSYLGTMAFSRSGLIEQLEFEGFAEDEATYGADNCDADWYEQAAKKAKSYLDLMSFSRDGLIDQLEFDGFTYEEAVYGAEQNGY